MARDRGVNVAADRPGWSGDFQAGVEGTRLFGKHEAIHTHAAQHIMHCAGIKAAEPGCESADDDAAGGGSHVKPLLR